MQDTIQIWIFKKKKKLWSIETQNIVKEVSVTMTESDENWIKLSITQTPHLYSPAILILQIWHKKGQYLEPITNAMASLYAILV